MHFPSIYQAYCDVVRDQSRVREGTPALRLENGQELAVITLSGHRVGGEPSPADWAQRIAEALAPKAPLKPVRKTAFSRDGYSFRPVTINGRPGFDVYPLNERSRYAQRGTIRLASDGATWLFHPSNGVADARPDFESIVLVVLAHCGKDSAK